MPYSVVAYIIVSYIGWVGLAAAVASLVIATVLRSAFAKKPSKGGGSSPQDSAQNRLDSVRSPIAPRQYIYGEVRTAGALTFIELSADGDFTYAVFTLSGRPVNAVGDIFFDGEDALISTDDNTNTNGLPQGRFSPHAGVIRSKGDEPVQPFNVLVNLSAGQWTDAHRQSGCAKLFVLIRNIATTFKRGMPNVNALVQGHKCFDPRTSLTGFTRNAALCVADYLHSTMFGIGAFYGTEIDEDALIAAINVCDERVLRPAGLTTTFTAALGSFELVLATGAVQPRIGDGVRVSTIGSPSTLPFGFSAGVTYYVIRGASGAIKLASSQANAFAGIAINPVGDGTDTYTLTYYDEARYSLDGTFLATAQPQEVIGTMLAAMAGKAVNVGGKWFIYAGAYDAPTVTLDEGDLAGPIQVQNLVSRRDNANGIKGIFTDPNSAWQPVSFPALASDTYMAEDGDERVWKDMDLAAFVTSGAQAQRLAKIELLGLRQGLTVRAQFKLTAWAAMTGATVALTNARFGWTAKAFEVMTSRFVVGGDGALGVELELRETAAAIFDWSTSEEQTVDIAPNTNLPSGNSIAAPGTPLIVEVMYDTTGSAGVKSKAVITWGASTGPYVATYKVEYKLTSASTWTALALVRETQAELLDATPGTYDFRVFAINQLGIISSASPNVEKELIGLTAAPADVTNFSVRWVSGNANVRMDMASDLDVRIGGRLLLRHSPRTSGAVWNDCLPLAPDGWPGDSVSVIAPLMAGTYMAKWQDSTGHASLNAAAFVMSTEAHLTGFTTLATVTENPVFTGVKTNTSVVSSALQLSGGVGSPVSPVSLTGSYDFANQIDLGSVLTVRLFPTIISTSFEIADQWDSDELVDSFEFVDAGGDVNDIVCAMEVTTIDSDPAGSPTPAWGPWHTLPGQADYTAQVFRFRLQFESGSVTHNRAVTVLSVIAKQPT